MSYSGPDLEETFEMFKRFLNDYEENRDKVVELERKLECRRCGHKCHTQLRDDEDNLLPTQCPVIFGAASTVPCKCLSCCCPICIVDRLPEWKKGR